MLDWADNSTILDDSDGILVGSAENLTSTLQYREGVSYFRSPVYSLPNSTTYVFVDIVDTRVEDYLTRIRERLLSLESNWDGEGAKPYKVNFVDQVLSFVRSFADIGNYASFLVSKASVVPVTENKIDLYWRLPQLELLVIFGADGSGSFYGDNTCRERIIQGEELPKPHVIYNWMEQLSAEMEDGIYTL